MNTVMLKKDGYIIAILVNGERRNLTQIKQPFTGNEELSHNINFGKNKSPIFRVRVRN